LRTYSDTWLYIHITHISMEEYYVIVPLQKILTLLAPKWLSRTQSLAIKTLEAINEQRATVNTCIHTYIHTYIHTTLVEEIASLRFWRSAQRSIAESTSDLIKAPLFSIPTSFDITQNCIYVCMCVCMQWMSTHTHAHTHTYTTKLGWYWLPQLLGDCMCVFVYHHHQA